MSFLSDIIQQHDYSTLAHSRNVSIYSMQIARALGYNDREISNIATAAMIHDIGKVGIPENILNKKGSLTSEEWGIIRNHPQIGVNILRIFQEFTGYLPIVQSHHERFDGTGYPFKLKGKEIPIDARILMVADSYEAMTSRRPYRDNVANKEQACNELIRCSGTQFDPSIVSIFISIIDSATPPLRC